MNTRQRLSAVPAKILAGAVLLAPLLAAAAVPQGNNLVGDETIVASLNPPAANSSCSDAAAQTSVYFNFAHPQFQVTQVSLYVDGRGVPNDAVDEHWPTVTLKSGLHPGLNTIDVVANGAAGQTMDRRLQVQIGAAQGADASAVVVACSDSATAEATPQAAPDAAPVAEAGADVAPSVAGGGDDGTDVVEAPPPAAVEVPPTVVADQPVYVDAAPVYYDYPAPVYVYNPYPVVALDPWVPFIPFFSFGFFYSNFHPYCPPPAFAYHDRWYGHGWGGGWHGNDWHGGGHGGGWGWHGGDGGHGGWRGGPGAVAGAGFHDPRGAQPGGTRFGGYAPHAGFASQNFAPHAGGAGAPSARGGFSWAGASAGHAYAGGGRGTFNTYQAPHSQTPRYQTQYHYAAPAAGRPYTVSAPSFHGGGQSFGGGRQMAWSAPARAGGGWGGGGFRAPAAPSFHGNPGGGFGGFHGGFGGGGGFHGGGGGGHHR